MFIFFDNLITKICNSLFIIHTIVINYNEKLSFKFRIWIYRTILRYNRNFYTWYKFLLKNILTIKKTSTLLFLILLKILIIINLLKLFLLLILIIIFFFYFIKKSLWKIHNLTLTFIIYIIFKLIHFILISTTKSRHIVHLSFQLLYVILFIVRFITTNV